MLGGRKAAHRRDARHAENFVHRASEHWQPPPFPVRGSFGYGAMAIARRVLDLQAASMWRDLRVELAGVQGNVLDVGAGAQPYRPLLEGKGVEYRAIDIAAASATFGYNTPDTDYFTGDVWPVATESVDLVLATETLEHVRHPEVFLGEARRVLRRDGRLVVTVPFSARWHYIPDDYWRFTPSSLRDLFEDAGFSDVVVYPRGNELTVACSKVAALILAGIYPSTDGRYSRSRAFAWLCTPLVPVLAAIAHISLRGRGGDDCLGWTATASAA